MKVTLTKRNRYWNEPGEQTIQIDDVMDIEIYLGSPDLTGRWTAYGCHMASIVTEGRDTQQHYNLEVYSMRIRQ